MGIGVPVVGEGWWRRVMGDEGSPQGVVMERVAAGVKPVRDWIPVPPITAMRTVPGES
jgi:hypothetical protein